MTERISDEQLADCIEVARQEVERYAANAHGRTRVKSNTLGALRELAELRELVRWRPMEEAPKDGRDVLVYCSDTKEQFVAFRDGDVYQYAYIRPTNTRVACRPTAWMPLPIGPLPGGDA